MPAMTVSFERPAPSTFTREGQAALRTLQDHFVADPQNTDLSQLRPVIARSWKRSLSCNVSPAMQTVEALAEPRLDEQVLQCAGPVLADLERMCADTKGCVSLADPFGTIAVFRAEPSVVRWAERKFPTLGGCMTEENAGTNSDGTVLEEGMAVQVWGNEHFATALQDTCCTSVPIRDPLRQSVRAVLALSLPVEIALESDARSIALIVQGAAAEITRALASRLAAREQALLSAYLRELRKRGTDAVVAMDDRMTIASRGAMLLLEQSDYAVLAGYAREAERLQQPVEHHVTAGRGRDLHLSASPVEAGDEPAGAVIRLRSAASTRASTAFEDSPCRCDPFATLVGGSLALRRALEVAATARTRGMPAYIVGETGTGKLHLAEALAACMAEVVVSFRCDGHDLAAEADVDRMRDELVRGHAVVLHRADTLSPSLREQVTRAIVDADERRVVVTTRRLTDGILDFVTGLGAVDVTMPPLRLRRDDIPLLVSHFLESMPDGPKAVSGRLLEALVEADWPGNVRQLREVIESAAARATGREIGVPDLTEVHRRGLARSPLSRLEEAELQEIREALAEAAGNRVKAAALLQIGRSTLYRRIDMYTRRGFDIGVIAPV